MWINYKTPQLVELAKRADRAAQVHFEAGRPYMQSLCEARAAELRAEVAKRQAVL